MSGKFERKDELFSLCGLNCSLCPMFVRGNCPGCQEGSHCALTCPFVPCSIEHGSISYCFECEEYPCRNYDGVDEYDSMISHKNQLRDIEKAKEMGINKYHQEQLIKREILSEFLKKYDNGHRDVFFCLAVNLMEIDELKTVLGQAEQLSGDGKSDAVKQMLTDRAFENGIELKLRKGKW